MAVLKFGNANVGKISVIEPYDDPIGHQKPAIEPWVRPSEWLDMPVIGSGDDKIAILMYVPSGELVPVDFGIRGTAYSNNPNSYSHTYSQINWGDGTSDIIEGFQHSTTPRAEHVFNFDNLPENTQFVHKGLVSRQALIEIDNSVSGCRYIDLYRFGLNEANDILQRRGVSSKILELHVASQNLEQIYAFYNSNYVQHRDMEKITIDTPNSISPFRFLSTFNSIRSINFPSGLFTGQTDFREFFMNCYDLTEVPYIDTSSATNMHSAFLNCRILEEIPDFINTSQVQSFTNMFYNCHRLKRFPNLDTSNAIDFYQTFYSCESLENIPSGLDFSNLKNFRMAFTGCRSIKALSNDFFDTMINVTGARDLFSGCDSLSYIPEINLPSCTEMSSMFSACRSLERVKVGNISSVTTSTYGLNGLFSECNTLKSVEFTNPEDINAYYMPSMFYRCYNLKKAPYMNLSSGVNISSMFWECYDLQQAPVYDVASATGLDGFYYSCRELSEIGGFENTQNVTGVNNLFGYNLNLRKLPSGLLENQFLGNAINFLQFSPLDPPKNITIDGNQSLTRLDNHPEIRDIALSGHMYRTFYYSSNISHLNNIDFSAVTGYYQPFYGSNRIQWIDPKNLSISMDFSSLTLGSGAINHIIENVTSGVTGQTLDFRNNYGISSLHSNTITTANAKGWTVLT